MYQLNMEEQIVHEKINGTVERCFKDRKEIVHLERLFQDRIKGAMGLKVRGISATTESFSLWLADEKNKRGLRIYLTHSQYGNTFKLTATEVIFRESKSQIVEVEKDFEKRLEEARKKGDTEEEKSLIESCQQYQEWEKEHQENKKKKAEKGKRAKAIRQEKEVASLVNDMRVEQKITESVQRLTPEERRKVKKTIDKMRVNQFVKPQPESKAQN